MKMKELMMVLRIEVSKRYGPPWPSAKEELPFYEDAKLTPSEAIENPQGGAARHSDSMLNRMAKIQLGLRP